MGAEVLSRVANAVRAQEAARVAEQRASVLRVVAVAQPWLESQAESAREGLRELLAAHERVGVVPRLFTLMGISHREKPYNRVLAWVCTPGRPHGLDRRVLKAIVARTGPEALLADLDDPAARIEVRGEKAWPSDAESNREPDLLILSDNGVLLIENKVGAGESGEGQYADYLEALQTLAEARGLETAAWLAAPQDRTVPTGADGEESWDGVFLSRR